MRIPHAIFLLAISCSISAIAAEPTAKDKVSYFKEIRPIFQARCQGCHQPAKRSGSFDMTSFAQLMKPGESGEPSIVSGDPDHSELIAQITPIDGKAAMPKTGEPLSSVEIDLIRRWIETGAHDDTPASAGHSYDQEHPPLYSRPPVITSLEFSPDGRLLAIAGFHEVILRTADGEKTVARLVGLSERIESVAFSPDGKHLAIAGGKPGRMGELQIWNVDKHELELSVPVSFDTIYGASWSPDGKIVAVGCSDSTVRGFNVETGSQVFFNGAHDDWPLDTVFSVDGSQLVSVGRDMSTKLYNVPTQRFVDNVTSITPGALKGGISALARHPKQNEILVGGSDGTPRIYRMERLTARVIGDDANLMRRYPVMEGRIYGVAFSPDGKTIACGSSLDGRGQVFTYRSEIPFEMPEDIKKIVQQRVSQQKPEEKQKLEEYVTADTAILTKTVIPAGVFALAYQPDGKILAAAGDDGKIRMINPADGAIIREFVPVEIQDGKSNARSVHPELMALNQEKLSGEESIPSGSDVRAIEVLPPSVELSGPSDAVQLLVTGILPSGDRIDLTRLARLEVSGSAVGISPLGRMYVKRDGEANLAVSFGKHHAEVPVKVSGVANPSPVSFIRDVNPVLTRLGCNQGTCHGAKDGKNGFKLSLRGYDPIYDVRAFTDDIKCRRTNVAAPDSSLMLLKASGAVPHVGGQLTRPGEPYYELIRRWIAEGAKLDMDVERVSSITIEPRNPVVQKIGARQQIRVVATYSNGRRRDVTSEAFLQSGNTEVAENNRAAVVTAIRRGESPILARFEGNYAATTLTVMGDRAGFVAAKPEIWSPVDKFVASKWDRMKIQPSGLCSDADFLRRVSLDLTGLPPSPEQLQKFASDPRPTRQKRDEVIDRLIGSDAYIEFWTNKWADLLQVNSKYLGTQGAALFRDWIRKNVASNRPYDEFAFEVLTASGSNKAHPAASYYKILREPDAMMENTTHLFLAIRFNCNKCHDHPFERWTQDQYYETAAYFAQVGLKRDPANAAGNIGGTAVEGAKPLWEEVFDKKEGEITHNRTGAVTAPQVPYDREIPISSDKTRREQLAIWITSSENDYFARSYVNRIWGYLLGVGLIEPLDDIRAGNPPSNPELLDWLSAEFIKSGFDVRNLMRTICKSRVYQLEIATNRWNEDDHVNYSHAFPKRLPAEVLYDAVYTVTGSQMKIPGVPEGTRAAALPDVQISLADGFLDNLGRPVRESACECERSSDLQLGPVMALMNGATISQAISQPGNALEKLVNSEPDNAKLINDLFLRILNRSATSKEIEATIHLLNDLKPEHDQLVKDLETYRKQIAPVLAAKEEKRQQAVASTQAELAAYSKEIQPKIKEAEQARLDRIRAAQAKIAKYLESAPERLAKWEQTDAQNQTPWTTLTFSDMKATNKAKLVQADDASVFASGPNGKGAYLLTSTATLPQFGSLQLEALHDERLEGKKGPGRSGGGNFVLTELSLEVWPVDKPKEKQEIKFKNARATFSQNGYDVKTAIDGKLAAASNGWAIVPETGKDQVATFEFAEPLKIAGPVVLQFKLQQVYQDGKHSLGKFRISVTPRTGEVNFGLPAAIVEIVNTKVEKRTAEQQAQLLEFFAGREKDYVALKKSLADAQKPVPEDPHLVELRETLEEYKKPLPADPQLSRMERAVELSEQQLKNSRLTAAQDLAWALINSPAFLFNR
jgi:WD40 repeat protein/mono/diheme cytochrome c family protein